MAISFQKYEKKIGYHNPILSKEILNNYNRFKIDCFISIF